MTDLRLAFWSSMKGADLQSFTQRRNCDEKKSAVRIVFDCRAVRNRCTANGGEYRCCWHLPEQSSDLSHYFASGEQRAGWLDRAGVPRRVCRAGDGYSAADVEGSNRRELHQS